MKPVVVIIGRPNVGKSTLFNRLTRGRDALVADTPGLTRDRQYGDGKRGDRPYLVVDTGGVVSKLDAQESGPDAIENIMREQTRMAVEQGDVIILLVDAREGVTAIDEVLARYLHRLGKPVCLAVNKSEGGDTETMLADFHGLGYRQKYAISAMRGDGVNGMIEAVLAELPHVDDETRSGDIPRVAVVGRPNVGKSTLVNRLLGEDRVIVFDKPGTTRDSIRVPIERQGKSYLFIDTAGVRRRHRVHETIEKFSVIKTLQAIDDANVVVLMLDADQGLAEQDAHLAGYILEQGRAMVLLINKVDAVDQRRLQWIERELKRRFAFMAYVRPYFISALHGEGLSGIFKSIDRVFAAACRTLGTSQLNRVLQQAVQATPPPRVKGRLIKPKFAHQGGKNPPRIVIHGNQVELLPENYRRYLAHRFRKAFRLEGNPLRIECRQGANPYSGNLHKKSKTYRTRSGVRQRRIRA